MLCLVVYDTAAHAIWAFVLVALVCGGPHAPRKYKKLDSLVCPVLNGAVVFVSYTPKSFDRALHKHKQHNINAIWDAHAYEGNPMSTQPHRPTCVAMAKLVELGFKLLFTDRTSVSFQI